MSRPLEAGRALRTAPAQGTADARGQFFRIGRVGEAVVRPAVEQPGRPAGGEPCGERDHRRLCGAEDFRQKLKRRREGKRRIEEDKIRRSRFQRLQPACGVAVQDGAVASSLEGGENPRGRIGILQKQDDFFQSAPSFRFSSILFSLYTIFPPAVQIVLVFFP